MTTKTDNSSQLASSFIALTENEKKILLLFNKLDDSQKEYMLRIAKDAITNKDTVR